MTNLKEGDYIEIIDAFKPFDKKAFQVMELWDKCVTFKTAANGCMTMGYKLVKKVNDLSGYKKIDAPYFEDNRTNKTC